MIENTEQSQSVETELPTQESESLNQTQETPKEQPSIIDLDTMEKFKFGGREWTPKELKSAYMMQSDYSKKTAEIAQERKFSENLIHDLRTIRQKMADNPAIIDEFKRIYPKKYHAYADEMLDLLRSTQKPTQQMQQPQSPSLPPEIQRKIDLLEEKMGTYERNTFEAEVAKHASELERTLSTLSQKYPFADEEQVLSRAQALRERGEELDQKAWDGLFKMVNEKNENFLKQRQSEMIKKQNTANQKAKDVASGGGTPAQAPRKFRTIKEASEAAIKDLAN